MSTYLHGALARCHRFACRDVVIFQVQRVGLGSMVTVGLAHCVLSDVYDQLNGAAFAVG